MELTYAEFLEKKEKQSNMFYNIKKFTNVLSDIPLVGNTLKTGTEVVADVLEIRGEFAKSLGEGKKDSTYFVLESNDYYSELFEKVFKVLEIQEIREKFEFDINDLTVSIEEMFNENWDVLEEAIIIKFHDDIYVNDRTFDESIGTVYITFIEKFKQINFENEKVYSAFETLALGVNHHQAKRDYCKLAEFICHFLSNSKLLK